ncbi:MAG: TIGR03960 family B12-binding radical SAM protein [Lachnospiraceae bacterium]|nr:TIGR03960 family B12-binding radical SAM protein [Lachnospiraceae bacterium]
MKKEDRILALDHDTLMSIEKPARYIGGELNSINKAKSDIRLRFCMCFPDIYEIGMSHLGISILYGMMNSYDDVWCERVFSPWTDLDKVLREKNIPLFALESQDPVKDFDFLGITLQYEMCYTNVLQILDLSMIPIYQRDRGMDEKLGKYPIVIGGGPCIYNAEPIADFFDIFYIGEGETMYRALFDLYEESKEKGLTRKEFLVEAAKLQGIYVPCLYDVKYNEDNTIKSMNPIVEGIPATVKKEVVKELDDVFFPTKPIVPFIRATQDRIVLEVQRGCIRGCRFCQAGQIYKPIRTRSVDKLMEYAAELVKSTGYDEMSLSSLSTSDYPDLEELLNKLIDLCAEKKMNISLPSLRIDAFSLDVMSKVQDVRKTSLTFAPEAGSQRMRNVINKGLTKDNILSGATMAFQGGWNKVKLYFMLGLPFETDEDIKEIMYLCNDIAAAYYEAVPKEKRMGRVQVSASTSFFIPKPFTAFQWAPMNNMQQFIDKAELTKKTMLEQLNKKSISYKWHEAGTSVVEGVFARGDRRISDAIYYAYRNGCLFDAWTEEYKHDVWMDAFEKYGAGLDFYIFRERNVDEILPWDILDIGVNKSYLVREWENARNEKVTENCKDKCAGCGAFTYKCGICPR